MKKIILYIIFLLVYIVFTYNCSAKEGFWQKAFPISQLKYNNKYPSVSINNNKIAICWVTYKKNIPYIYYTLSKNNIFSRSKPIHKLRKYKLLKPDILLLNNKVYISWSDENNNIIIYREKEGENSKITTFSNKKDYFLPKFIPINNKLFLFFEKNINKKKFDINYIIDNTFNEYNFIRSLNIKFGFYFPRIKLYNDRVYTLWVNRTGKNKIRSDKLFLKVNNDNIKNTLLLKEISKTNENVLSSDFIINNKKLYITYVSSEIKNYQIYNTIVFKIFYIKDNNIIEEATISTNFNFNNYYEIRLLYFKEKFYLFWYSLKNNKREIFYSISENFKEWSKPYQITKSGKNNRHFVPFITPDNNLALVYEKELKNKTIIYYKELDNKCLPPIVYSTTHKSNRWSYSRKVILKWKQPRDISGIKGFSYIIDKEKNTVPDILNISPDTHMLTFKAPENGIFYFHIRSIDNADNWSKVVTYKFMINDSIPEPPLITSPTHKEYIPSNNLSPIFEWHMKDNRKIKGYSYKMTQFDYEMPENKINIRKNRIKFKDLAPGLWYFKIKACDALNRWTDYSTFTLNLEKLLIASKISEEVKSRYSYRVGKGESLVMIINKVLKLKKPLEYRKYIKAVASFNYLQNYDFLKPGEIIMFPIILAKPGDTRKKLSIAIYGSDKFYNKFVVVGKKDNKISVGDKIIIKDSYFLKTGIIKNKKLMMGTANEEVN